MFFKSRGLRLLLAALLVFAQQQAVLHLLGHSFEQLTQKKDATDPQEQVCAKCLALAHLDHVLSGDPVAITLPDSRPDSPPPAAHGRVGFAVVLSYRSRAPPIFS